MILLTEALKKQIPLEQDTADKQATELTVYAKLFLPGHPATWYVYSWDGKDILWVYANLTGDDCCWELGPVALEELKSLSFMGLKVERDKLFKKCNLQELMNKIERGERV